MSNKKTDLHHPVGYDDGEQHVGKSKVDPREDKLPPQAGTHGQPDSHISGQSGAEILGGSASTRVTGQSVDEQLKFPLPNNSRK
ncbi:unnamed protein product [Rotaria sordida]|uniref:Uncharacterized protein n=1 Tax=Rotaria sordida TaxID=392033 RepID=A0A814YZG4_9BILA|nr:unnamed protein product [Rotaria sordida]CAF1188556.1 unnamed protein product [Rotaria sordida]CAF1236121.1 unnamed protein product [Rotaria sordida]CAF1240495.1 unnamed protein product [Rotaria sordida]CAF3703466.1 unnamed protein product [Rotaria sordida]